MPSARALAGVLLLIIAGGGPVAAQAPDGPPPEAGRRAAGFTSRPPADSRERQRALLDTVVADAAAGRLSLLNGHLWWAGHIDQYAFYSSEEKTWVARLAGWRHRPVHEVTRLRHGGIWQEGMEQGAASAHWPEVSTGHRSGGAFVYEAFAFELPPLAPTGPGGERFLQITPEPLQPWPEMTLYVDGRADAALMFGHHYVALDQLPGNSTRPRTVVLKSFHISPEPRGFGRIAVVERDPVADRLYWNVRSLAEAASILPEDEPARGRLRDLLAAAFRQLDGADPAAPGFATQLAAADRDLEAGRLDLAASVAPSRPTVHALGHGHLDTIYRWAIAHSPGKLERQVLNNLYLMRRYPEYRYIQTSPAHYQWMQRLRPDLFARLQAEARAGRWIANGAMFTEADVHLPSGESLVRQFLYGLEYFERHFGTREHVLFLPDTFGFSPALPQLMRGFGVDLLASMRIHGGPGAGRAPYDAFRWVGIDGSEVVASAFTTPAWEYPQLPELHGGRSLTWNYSAPDLGARRVFGAWEQYRQKREAPEQILPTGHGDGGGGAVEDHLELARRTADIPGLPALVWTNLTDFAARRRAAWDRLPRYDDEIFVGFQRTFTRANAPKMENRWAEQALHDTEFLGAWARHEAGFDFDARTLREAWELVLLNQQHDIITGQGIPEVYEDTARDYARVRGLIEPVRSRALAALAARIDAPAGTLLLFNPLSQPRGGVREIVLPTGTPAPAGAQPAGPGRILLHLGPSVPAYGYAVATATTSLPGELRIAGDTLENRFLRVRLDAQGRIASLFDKESRRELVPPGRRHNQLLAVRAGGGFGPAPAAGASTGAPEEINALAALAVVEHGPLRAGWEIRRTHGRSTIVQRLLLAHDARRLDVECDIDWREATELHADFPLPFRTRVAHQEIQFGHLAQTTTRNSPEDAGRDVLWAHRWVDVAEEDYGFALLNRVRYGHDVKGGGIRLVLFTNAQAASANSDRGAGRFAYALLPHAGTAAQAGIAAAAADFNHPLLAVVRPATDGAPGLPAHHGLFSVTPATVVLDTVKPAEDGDGWILRLFESAGRTSEARLRFGLPVRSAELTDLRERPAGTLELAGDATALAFTPFQIRTLRLRP